MESNLPNQRFASIWDALEETPQAAEQMKLRSALMIALEQHIAAKEWTQEEGAHHIGISLSQMSDLMEGNINVFNLEDLVSMLVGAGLRLDVTISEAAVAPQKPISGAE